MFLARQEAVGQFRRRQTVALNSRRSARVQIVSLIEILLQRRVRVRPGPEIMQLTPDLLGPPSRRVRKERELRVGLVWAVKSSTLRQNLWVNLECFGKAKARFIRHDRAKRMCWCEQQKVAPAGLAARAERGHSSRPDLDIPRWVARQQSPTPFHQAVAIVRDVNLRLVSPALHASQQRRHSFCPVMP